MDQQALYLHTRSLGAAGDFAEELAVGPLFTSIPDVASHFLTEAVKNMNPKARMRRPGGAALEACREQTPLYPHAKKKSKTMVLVE